MKGGFGVYRRAQTTVIEGKRKKIQTSSLDKSKNQHVIQMLVPPFRPLTALLLFPTNHGLALDATPANGWGHAITKIRTDWIRFYGGLVVSAISRQSYRLSCCLNSQMEERIIFSIFGVVCSDRLSPLPQERKNSERSDPPAANGETARGGNPRSKPRLVLTFYRDSA